MSGVSVPELAGEGPEAVEAVLGEPAEPLGPFKGPGPIGTFISPRTGQLFDAQEATYLTEAVELRVISNTTGDRQRQTWDLPSALGALGEAVRSAAWVLR